MTEDISKIVRQNDDGTIIIDCAFCEGKGVFPESHFDDGVTVINEPCTVCSGKGIQKLRDKSNILKCRFCDGDGRAWEEDNGAFVGNICPVCNGIGIIYLDDAEDAPISLEEEIWSLIHPEITKIARSRYEASHYADAVESSLKEVNVLVKDVVKKSTGKELDGAPLMQFALSIDNPIIQLADLTTENGRNIQKGYIQIFSGAMTGIRNPKAHKNITIDKNRAIHLIFLASLLMHKVTE